MPRAQSVQTLVIKGQSYIFVLSYFLGSKGYVVGLDRTILDIGRIEYFEADFILLAILYRKPLFKSRTHPCPCSPSHRVMNKKALKALALLCYFPNHVEYIINIVSAKGDLPSDEVIR